jgi:hypothetical protein
MQTSAAAQAIAYASTAEQKHSQSPPSLHPQLSNMQSLKKIHAMRIPSVRIGQTRNAVSSQVRHSRIVILKLTQKHFTTIACSIHVDATKEETVNASAPQLKHMLWLVLPLKFASIGEATKFAH